MLIAVLVVTVSLGGDAGARVSAVVAVVPFPVKVLSVMPFPLHSG